MNFGTVKILEEEAKLVNNSLVIKENGEEDQIQFYDKNEDILYLKSGDKVSPSEIKTAKYHVIGDDGFDYGEIQYEDYKLPIVKKDARVLGTTKQVTNKIEIGEEVYVTGLPLSFIKNSPDFDISKIAKGKVIDIRNSLIVVETKTNVFPLRRNCVSKLENNTRRVFCVTKRLKEKTEK